MAKKKTTQAPPVPDWFREQFRNRYFVCYLDWAPILSALENPADYKRVMEAAFQYADTGAVPQLDGISMIVFLSIKKDMDKDFEHAIQRGWKAYCAEAGRHDDSRAYVDTPAPTDGRAPAITHNTQHLTHNTKHINNNTQPYPSHAPAHEGMGVGGSVGGNFSLEKPSSYSEFEEFCIEHVVAGFEYEELWEEMEDCDWKIQDKNSRELRPLKNWRNFVKYRIEKFAEENEPNDDYPVFSSPEDKKLYEQWKTSGSLQSFESFKRAMAMGYQTIS